MEWKVHLKDISSSAATTINNDARNYDDDDCDDSYDETQSVRRCIASRSIVLSDDRRILYAPLLKRIAHPERGANAPQNDIMAVVVFRYGSYANTVHRSSGDHHDRLDETDTGSRSRGKGDGGGGCYSEEDVITARVMARHIAIFMDR